MNDILFILSGVWVNIKYSFISVFLGFFIGILIALLNLSSYRALKFCGWSYISFIQSVPLPIQLGFMVWGVPAYFNLSPWTLPFLCILALSINSAAYVAEHIRVGIASVAKSEVEAAYSLRLSQFTIYRYIILPQAFVRILPSLRSELVNMFKETSILSLVGETDILRQAQRIATRDYSYILPYFYAAVIYYCLVNLIRYGFDLYTRKV